MVILAASAAVELRAQWLRDTTALAVESANALRAAVRLAAFALGGGGAAGVVSGERK
jgi:hypothetical protein